MNCPNCNKELIVVERNGIELDYCPDCNGFWFDNKEWDLLHERLVISDSSKLMNLDLLQPVNVQEAPKCCPYCNSKMDKILAYWVVLDRCPKGHGVWFDKGECSRVFSSATDKAGTPIEFLGEVFCK